MLVSVIVPVLNEEDSIEALITGLSVQSRAPDEIVVADGGSTDQTRAILARLVDTIPSLRVVDGPGGISANRNAAIRAASHPAIACTDAGCVPNTNWLEELTAPFATGAEWVAGFYRPVGRTAASTAAGAVMMTTLPEVNLDHFLPGGSSQAFTKRVWERVGGFPEGSGVGEDTLFGEQLRALGYRPVFAPAAEVAWEPPRTLSEMAKKSFRWGNADGTHQVRSGAYAKVLAAYWIFPMVAVLAAMWQPFLGGLLFLAFLALVAYRTRHKYGVMSSPSRFFWIPLAHLRQQWAASAGWLKGYGLLRLLQKVWERISGRVPTGNSHMGSARHNVDVFLPTDEEAFRWLPDLPTTYRVGVGAPDPTVPRVYATLERQRHREPLVAPLRVEGIETTATDPVAAFEQLRQTGLRYQLVPTPGGTRTTRSDVITEPTVVILAAVPTHDVGGGSRGAQIAQQLISEGVHVTYLYRFEAAESVDLGLRVVSPLLEERRWDEFDLAKYLPRLGSSLRMVLVEFPSADHLSTFRRLAGSGFHTVYDLIDDWTDRSLGGDWYRRSVEEEFISLSSTLVSSAASLQANLSFRSSRSVLLLPNAVNPRLFDPNRQWSRPDDLPPGPVFEYHGSLYGDWLDWDAVTRVADEIGEATVVLIGDRPRPLPSLPNNVAFLGLKPQVELAAYLAHTEVALIPFMLNETTHAVSPLKVFEYLAMGVPVASPPLQPVLGLKGVHCDRDLTAAVRAAREAPRPDPQFSLQNHSWERRTAALRQTIGWPQQTETQPVYLETRPAHTYPPHLRRLSLMERLK